jgi:response regulator of citrate/malate metabolism
MKHYYKRLDLTKLEYDYLIKCIDFEKLEEIEKRIVKNNENFEIVKSFNIIEKLNNPKEIEYSTNKSIAAMKATEIRSKKVKYKMNIAIEILQTQKKEITHYAIAKISKVSFNTVKKHLSDEHIKSLNEMN